MNYKINPRNTLNVSNKGNLLQRIIKLIIWSLVMLIVYLYINYNSFKEKEIIENDFVIKIEKGDNFYNLGDKIIELNNMYYKIYIKNNKPSYDLKAGNYKIKGGSSITEVLDSLNKPISTELSITILEGWNIYDIDNFLNKKGLINSGEYINYVTDKEKITALSEFFKFIKDQTTLEGFLYPDTYNIDSTNFKINKFVINQLETFEKKVYERILQDLSIKKINELINLSSIVEKEERNIIEKSIVAGILKKRLNNNWKIGADITVCYPYKLTSEECKMVISKYINEENDYNTRTMVGLPKTPIGNPSFNTIYSTLNSKNTPYWFYLHNTQTGEIHYAVTNEEHEENKRMYMR